MKNKIIVLLLSMAACVIVETRLNGAAIDEPPAKQPSGLNAVQIEGAQKIAHALFKNQPLVVKTFFTDVFEIALLENTARSEGTLRMLKDEINKTLCRCHNGASLASLNNHAKSLFEKLLRTSSAHSAVRYKEGNLDARFVKPNLKTENVHTAAPAMRLDEFGQSNTYLINRIAEYLSYRGIASLAQSCKSLYQILTDGTAKPTLPIRLQTNYPIHQATFSADEELLVTVAKDSCIPGSSAWSEQTKVTSVWDVKKRANVTRSLDISQYINRNPQNGIESVAFSPESKFLAIIYDNGIIIVKDATTGKTMALLDDSPYHSTEPSLAISSDGSLLATSKKYSNIIKVWEVQTGTIKAELTDCTISQIDQIDGLIFLADNTLVSKNRRSFKRWDVTSKQVIQQFESPSPTIAINFYSNGDMIGYEVDGSKITLWDIKTGKPITELIDSTAPVTAVGFSEDGKLIATGCQNGNINTWDIKTGTLIRWQLAGNAFPAVTSLAFSRDGKTLVAGHEDGSIIIS